MRLNATGRVQEPQIESGFGEILMVGENAGRKTGKVRGR